MKKEKLKIFTCKRKKGMKGREKEV